MKRIYLDHNATTPLDSDVREAMVRALETVFGNPSSIHREGQKARAMVEHARRATAGLIGGSFTDIVFTSGATEANNIALRTLAKHSPNGVVTSPLEHPSILNVLDDLGVPVHLLPVDSLGRLPNPEAIIAFCEQHDAKGLSLMLANNEIGNITPIAEIVKLARPMSIMVHTDATQAVGKIDVNVAILETDLLSLSAHKFYGPKGVGALHVRMGVEIAHVVKGGHQERGRRGGTENVWGVVGIGRAAEIALRALDADSTRIEALRDRLWAGIQGAFPDAVRQGDPENTLPNTLNVRFADVDGETLLMNLDLDGISVSAGSACTAGSLEPSHVILATGVDYKVASGSIRFSLGKHNTDADIDTALARLPGVLSRSR